MGQLERTLTDGFAGLDGMVDGGVAPESKGLSLAELPRHVLDYEQVTVLGVDRSAVADWRAAIHFSDVDTLAFSEKEVIDVGSEIATESGKSLSSHDIGLMLVDGEGTMVVDAKDLIVNHPKTDVLGSRLFGLQHDLVVAQLSGLQHNRPPLTGDYVERYCDLLAMQKEAAGKARLAGNGATKEMMQDPEAYFPYVLPKELAEHDPCKQVAFGRMQQPDGSFGDEYLILANDADKTVKAFSEIYVDHGIPAHLADVVAKLAMDALKDPNDPLQPTFDHLIHFGSIVAKHLASKELEGHTAAAFAAQLPQALETTDKTA